MKKILKPEELPTLNDVGFKVYSQFEEDGILLYIFSVIGTTNQKVIEICAGNCIECMAANLIINHGWQGLLFDGDNEKLEVGREFYSSNRSTWIYPPVIKHAWLTRENVNQIIEDTNFIGNIDLLSLDVDGNDYYIMESINVIKPRVIVCETHIVNPSNLSLTIPYNSDFNREHGDNREFLGVSLLAMKNLMKKKGYRLIGSHRYGFNVFFMMDGVGETFFPEVSVESVHNNDFTKLCINNLWPRVKNMPWVDV